MNMSEAKASEPKVVAALRELVTGHHKEKDTDAESAACLWKMAWEQAEKALVEYDAGQDTLLDA
jgi:hypothetical protein